VVEPSAGGSTSPVDGDELQGEGEADNGADEQQRDGIIVGNISAGDCAKKNDAVEAAIDGEGLESDSSDGDEDPHPGRAHLVHTAVIAEIREDNPYLDDFVDAESLASSDISGDLLLAGCEVDQPPNDGSDADPVPFEPCDVTTLLTSGRPWFVAAEGRLVVRSRP